MLSNTMLYRTLLLLGVVSVASPEAFSSTAHLKLLARAEGDVVGMLDRYMEAEEYRLAAIRRMIPYLQKSASISNPTTAGHPVNAYHLVKRWYLLSKLAANVGESPEFQEFVDAHGLQMPTEADYIGASAALLRLQRTYSLPTPDLAKGKVFDEFSDEPLHADDCFLIGDTAMKNNDYGLAAQWFDMSTQYGMEDSDFNLPDAFMRLAHAHKTIGDMAAAVQAAQAAEKLAPENSTIKAEMWSLVSQKENLDRENYVPRSNMSTWERFVPDWKSQYEALCRGDKVYRPPEVLASLTCRYKRGRLLPYVVYKEETLSWNPRISMFYDVISDNEAELIKRLATPLLYRAVVGDPAKAFATNERVSKVAWLWDTDENDGFAIKRLSDRVEDVTGLETEYRAELSSSEPFQVVNYGIGGQYEPHVDFYEDKGMLDSVPYFIKYTGDRITTFLFYLSDIKYGGATVFPQVGVRVPAIKNAAAFWYNAKPSGEFDGNTQHAGCPVLVGEKWVANKWIREYGQEFRRPCPVDQNAVWNV